MLSKRRNKLFIGFVVLGLAIVQTLSGCANDTAPSNRKAPALPVYPDGVFPVNPDKGEKAQLDNLEKIEATVAHFGKRFNKPDLDAVLRASALSTVDYVRGLGVSLYRIPRDAKNRAPVFFSMLPLPPPNLNDLWKSAGNDTPGVVIGLYQDVCNSDCRDDRPVNPVILVDEASERWTLVHEMLHFAFEEQLKREGAIHSDKIYRSIEATYEQMDRLEERYREVSDEVAKASVMKSIGNAHMMLFDLAIESILNAEFEEVTIEHLLMQKWSTGDFQYVPLIAVANAEWYLKTSRAEGINVIQSIEKLMWTLSDRLKAHGLQDFFAEDYGRIKAKISGMKTKSEALQVSGEKIWSEAKKRYPEETGKLGLKNFGINFMSLVAQPRCQHGRIDRAELIERLNNLATQEL